MFAICVRQEGKAISELALCNARKSPRPLNPILVGIRVHGRVRYNGRESNQGAHGRTTFEFL